jgi:hypothetical protein
VLTTPARWKSVFYGEPHWQLRGLAALPFASQRVVAEKLFGRDYPYPIERQFSRARHVVRPYPSDEFEPAITLTPRFEGLANRLPFLRDALCQVFWDRILLVRRTD